jgi:L-asparaginase
MARLPKIALVLTGGTIDALGRDRLDLVSYIESGRRLDPSQLLAQVPELKSIAELQVVPFRRVAGHGWVEADWLNLVRTIHRLLEADEAHGVVVTHGTNTIEETAYFLNLTAKSDRAVILVGAMRPASAISADGWLNLVNAVRVAAAPGSRGRGALLVMNDRIYAARDVTKSATYRLEAFQGRDLGPLGYADADGGVVYFHRTEKLHTMATDFDVRDIPALPRVDVVISYVGADGAMIDAAVKAGARGIVSAATGAGWPTPAEEEALKRARDKGIVVCISSRVGSGRVVRTPGHIQRRWVTADDLPPWKARILLALALTRTDDLEEIQRCFDVY